jgi:hypothetical protein
MPYEITMQDRVIAAIDPITKDIKYYDENIREIIAGQSTGGSKGGKIQMQSARVSYRFDKNRKANNDTLYKLYKGNGLVKNRVTQMDSLLFGRGFGYSYDESTKEVIDAFWRYNRLKSKLDSIGTDIQVYGETFIGLFPQPNGQTLVAIYEPNQVEVDFEPDSVDNVIRYIVSWKNEETNKDEQIEFKPLHLFLNEAEYGPMGTKGTAGKVIRAVKKALKVSGATENVMVHIKFNNTSTEVHGSSDFLQVYPDLMKYMDFRSDRMSMHQMYGSPAYDISIETNDDDTIKKRIEELAGFVLGSNPVHNDKEKWTPLEFKNNSDSAEHDEKAQRGLVAAGFGFPEHMVFNQSSSDNIGGEAADGTVAMHKLVEDRQDALGDAFQDIHRFVCIVAGIDATKIDEGQMIFPTISTMSEKTKAETYTLLTGASIVSRRTAALDMGFNWSIEKDNILAEDAELGDIINKVKEEQQQGGQMGGRFTTRKDSGKSGSDDGSANKKRRLTGSTSGTTQIRNSQKQKSG